MEANTKPMLPDRRVRKREAVPRLPRKLWRAARAVLLGAWLSAAAWAQ